MSLAAMDDFSDNESVTSSCCTITEASLVSHRLVSASDNAGFFSLLSVDLFQYFFSTALTCPSDVIAFGRSCKWLYYRMQATDIWRILYHPTSPFAPFAGPSIPRPLALPKPLSSSWSTGNSPLTTIVCIPLAALHGTVHGNPLLVHHSTAQDQKNWQPWLACEADHKSFLPLFLTQNHFDAAFPLLQDQVRQVLITQLRSNGPHAGIPSIPRAMIVKFFPHVILGMASKLALSERAPTAHDLEAFVQVHLLWRAAIHRFRQDSYQWIAAEIQRLVNALSQGGNAARAVPLMELMVLLHVCGEGETKQWTWPKVARGIIDENTIRLFRHIHHRAESEPLSETEEADGVRMDDFSITVGNALGMNKTDAEGFVYWPVLFFHLLFMRTIRSIPSLDDTAVYAGHFRNNQILEPGRLAHLLQAQVKQRIQQQPTVDAWPTLLRRLGASPIDSDTLNKWLTWCDKQARITGRCGYWCSYCSSTYREAEVQWNQARSASTATRSVASATLAFATSSGNASGDQPHHQLLCPTFPIPEPSFTFVALNSLGALLDVRTDLPTRVPTSTGVLPKPSITGPSVFSPPIDRKLRLDLLPSYVSFVAVFVLSEAAHPSVHCTLDTDDLQNSDSSKHTLEALYSPLPFVFCRGIEHTDVWHLIHAGALSRRGTIFVRSIVGMTASESTGAIVDFVKAAREWVAKYVMLCRKRGVDALAGKDVWWQ